MFSAFYSFRTESLVCIISIKSFIVCIWRWTDLRKICCEAETLVLITLVMMMVVMILLNAKEIRNK